MNEIFKDFCYLCLLFLLTWCGLYLYTRHDTIEQRVQRYDCNLTEFQPRIPEDIRNACRQITINKINNQKD